MHLRRRVVLAPRWVRVPLIAAAFAAYTIALGLFFDFGYPWWVLSIVGSVAFAVYLLLGGEDRQRQRFSRHLGWTGDPLSAVLARADVDDGLVPEEDAVRRELARRYTAELSGRVRRTRVTAVVLALVWLAVVGLALTVDGMGKLVVVYLVIAIGPQYQAWVRLPRHRRVHERLGENDADWAAHQNTRRMTPSDPTATGLPRPS